MTDAATAHMTPPTGTEMSRPRFALEERMNAITHGVGLALGVAGAGILLAAAVSRGDPWQVFGCSLYALTLIATYAASTLSHIAAKPAVRHAFRVADQSLIFLFIAGSYTGVATTWLRTPQFWWLHTVLWGVALAGFASKAIFSHRVHVGTVSTWLYLILGWTPFLAAKSLAAAMPWGLQVWMLAGGACYTLGLVFFCLDHRVPYFHAAWHVLVIAGSACHYGGILLYCTAHVPM